MTKEDVMMETKSARNHLLDFMKGCGCIGVVWIHFLFPGMTGVVVNKIFQYVVPVFLLISGYYSYSSKGDASIKIKKHCKRIAKITAYALALYFIYSVIKQIQADNFGAWIMGFLSGKQWIRMIFLSDFDIIGGPHLWFLPAQTITYLILLLIDQKNWYAYAYKALPAIFLCRIAFVMLALSMNWSWHVRGNFLVGALPWMLLGNYLAYNKKERFSNSLLCILFLCSGFWIVISVILFKQGILPVDLTELGIMVYVPSLFMLALKNPSLSISKRVENLGDRYSLYVYIIHFMIGKCIGAVAESIGIQTVKSFMWCKPIIVAICSLIVSILYYHVVFYRGKKRV